MQVQDKHSKAIQKVRAAEKNKYPELAPLLRVRFVTITLMFSTQRNRM